MQQVVGCRLNGNAKSFRNEDVQKRRQRFYNAGYAVQMWVCSLHFDGISHH